MGPSIKYVMLFLRIFDPPPPVTNCHKSSTSPLKVCHTSEPPPRYLEITLPSDIFADISTTIFMCMFAGHLYSYRGILEGYFNEKVIVPGQSSANLWHEL